MKVKRYVASTMQEAMQQVRTELGREAVILHTRKIKRKGIAGLFGAKMVEVTAAVESEPYEQKEINHLASKQLTEQQSAISKIFNELYQMKELLNHLNLQNQKIEVNCSKELMEAYTSLAKVQQNLIFQGVDEFLAKKIIALLLEKLSEAELHDPDCIFSAAEKEIISLIGEPEPITLKSTDKPKVVSLIGPTGVGKTTTIAKLAANFALFEKKDVLLVTADTYRIAAPEQLRTYGDIMNLQVMVVFTPQELSKVVQENKDKDLIILDTAGRSQKNLVHLNEIKGFIEAVPTIETYLCVSANTKPDDILEIVQNFKKVKIDKFIFTKLDETTTYGSIFNTLYTTRKPISYLTTGQDVPDDIEVADPKKIAKLLLREI